MYSYTFNHYLIPERNFAIVFSQVENLRFAISHANWLLLSIVLEVRGSVQESQIGLVLMSEEIDVVVLALGEIGKGMTSSVPNAFDLKIKNALLVDV